MENQTIPFFIGLPEIVNNTVKLIAQIAEAARSSPVTATELKSACSDVTNYVLKHESKEGLTTFFDE